VCPSKDWVSSWDSYPQPPGTSSRLDRLLLSDAQQHQFPGGATSQQRYGYPKENFGYLRFAGYKSLEYLRFPGCKYFGYVRFPGYKKLGHEVS
jgi:hypothetical protein